MPAPESVSYTYDEFSSAETGEEVLSNTFRAIDIRYINPPKAPRGEPVTETQLMWMRINETLPDSPNLHQVGIAYLSDSTLVDPILLPHGLRWQDADFEGTSLDHAMWFHRVCAGRRVAAVRIGRRGHRRRSRLGKRADLYSRR